MHSVILRSGWGSAWGRGWGWGPTALTGWASEGKQKRKEARSASKTSTRNSSFFLGLASNPFAGSRPCMTSPSAPPCHAAAPLMVFALPTRQPRWPSFERSDGNQALRTSGPLHWLLLLPRTLSSHTPQLSLSGHTSHPSGMFTGLREGTPALGGHIPLPQHPLPLPQTLMRFVIPSLFVLVSVCPAPW